MQLSSFWESVLLPLLTVRGSQHIVEIGTGEGDNTEHLLSYCTEYNARLDSIDPIKNEVTTSQQQKGSGVFTFYNDYSFNALPNLSGYDTVIIDGDHNWYTVFNELLIIENQHKKTPQNPFPLVILHDVCWPYGRRDLYYNPQVIPDAYRQVTTQQGLIPYQAQPAKHGGINEGMHHSIYEGNPKNGVRTAVEDFLEQSKERLHFAIIPGGHGIGIICAESLLQSNASLAQFFEELVVSEPLSLYIDQIEYNRITQILDRDRRIASVLKYNENINQRRGTLNTVIRTLKKELHSQEEKFQLQEEKFQLQEEKFQLQEEKFQLQEEKLQHINHLAEKMQRSKSWRWTYPLRKGESLLRNYSLKKCMRRAMHGIIGGLHDLWTDFGQPFPRLARFVRHTLLRRLPIRNCTTVATPPPYPLFSNVAVIIHCHNAEYIEETVHSVLAQTLAPSDIVILDETGSQNVEDLVNMDPHKRLRLIRKSWYSKKHLYNFGIEITRSECIVIISTDDILHEAFLQCAIDVLQSAEDIGCTFADTQNFGVNEDRTHYSDDGTPQELDNLPCASIVFRKEALQQAGNWKDSDNKTLKSLLNGTWRFAKNPGLHMRRQEQIVIDSPMQHATLFLALSGRTWAWPMISTFLEKQEYPHNLLSIVILDTSQDSDFGTTVRQWLEGCDYHSHSYFCDAVGPKGLADLPRIESRNLVADACVTIYNRFARLCTTPLAFFLEDDVIPPLDAYTSLVSHLKNDIVSVSGYYTHRDSNNAVAWEWKNEGQIYKPIFATPHSGVRTIGGNGFGCVVMHGDTLRRTTFHAEPPYNNYDHNFYYHTVLLEQKRALIDWDCPCEHLSKPS